MTRYVWSVAILAVFLVLYVPFVHAGYACISSASQLPVYCDGTLITDTLTADGCRQLSCDGLNGSLTVKACDRPNNVSATYFEMYRTNSSGIAPVVCLADVCLQNGTYAKSSHYPYCYGTTPLSGVTIAIADNATPQDFDIAYAIFNQLEVDGYNSSTVGFYWFSQIDLRQMPAGEMLLAIANNQTQVVVHYNDVQSSGFLNAMYFVQILTLKNITYHLGYHTYAPTGDPGELFTSRSAYPFVVISHRDSLYASVNIGYDGLAATTPYTPESAPGVQHTIQITQNYFNQTVFVFNQTATGRIIDLPVQYIVPNIYFTSLSPNATNVTVTLHEPQTFRADISQEHGVTVRYTWSLDGTPYDTRIVFTPEPIVTNFTGTTVGTHTLSLHVEAFNYNTIDYQWQITVVGYNSTNSTNTTCYNSMNAIPASCTGGLITTDSPSGCRTIICTNGASNIQVLACEKGQYFEMYKQSQSGILVSKICIGTTCISDNGYAKSANYPICVGGQTNSTNQTTYSLTVQSTPTATLSINGTSYGTTPQTLSLISGNYLVSVNAQGYLPNSTTVLLAANTTVNFILQQIMTGNGTNQTNNTCYNSVSTIPATCTGGSITSDTLGGCRTLLCANGASYLQIMACDKSGFFEMYKQGQTGGLVTKICIGTTCISDNGFAKSSNYPICVNTTTNNTNTTDTTPPVLSNGQPNGVLSAGTTSATLSVTTNEPATCRYGTTAGLAYNGMTAMTDSNTAHSAIISGLVDGQSYNYYVKCRDTVGNTNTQDYQISFSVQQQTSTQCKTSVYDLPVSCTGSSLTQDTISGCRVVTCVDTIGTIQAMACNKPGDSNAQYFEMYKQTNSGYGVDVCIAGTCLANSGYARSPNFPICFNGTGGTNQTNSTNSTNSTTPSLALQIAPWFPQGRSYVFICNATGWTPATIEWYFGDGEKQTNTNRADVYYTYANPGTYTVECRASQTAISKNATLSISVT